MDATYIICTLIICVTVLTIFYMVTTKGIQFHNFNKITQLEDPNTYLTKAAFIQDKETEQQISEAYSLTREIQKLFLDDDQIEKEDEHAR